MMKIDFTYASECLGRDVNVKIFLPTGAATQPGKRWPTLYLLHGLTDCGDTWAYRTCLERYCDEHGIAVVLPTAQRSFYCDMVYGDAFFTHVAHEIPDLCESLFPLVPDDAHRYIAGNSMGGYGAFKIALKNPGKFAKAAAFSGVLDINQMIRDFPEYQRDWRLCFGGNHAPAEEDILALLPRAEHLPELYHYCGTDDFLAEGNHSFCQLCEKLGIPLTSTWEEGGTHSWLYWENQLPIMLRWLVQE